MNQKSAKATSKWLSSNTIRNFIFAALLGTGLYITYQLIQYGKRQSAYKQNIVLAQALDEYQKAQQGYIGSWETLGEIAATGATEQFGTVVQPYLLMLQAQAQQHLQMSADENVEDLVSSAWLEAEYKNNSVAMKDLLKISDALAGLDRVQKAALDETSNTNEPETLEQHIKTLESFFERLTGTQEPCEHYFDDYASYMLAYYWYSRGEIQKAKTIWAAIIETAQEGQEPSVWQQLSQSFLS